MTQLNKMFDDFNDQYGIKTQPLDHKLDGMIQIVGGEWLEFHQEANLKVDISVMSDSVRKFTSKKMNKQNFVKEAIDVIYAMSQQLRERGVDIDASLAEVHRSNMSKSVSAGLVDSEILMAIDRYPDAEPLKLNNGRYVIMSPSQGKVVKPTCYSVANITPEMIKQK